MSNPNSTLRIFSDPSKLAIVRAYLIPQVLDGPYTSRDADNDHIMETSGAAVQILNTTEIVEGAVYTFRGRVVWYFADRIKYNIAVRGFRLRYEPPGAHNWRNCGWRGFEDVVLLGPTNNRLGITFNASSASRGIS